MTIDQFIVKWKRVELKERGAAQEHFLDLCHLLAHPTLLLLALQPDYSARLRIILALHPCPASL